MDSAAGRVSILETSVVKRFADPRAFARELAVYRRGLDMAPRLIDYLEPLWIRLRRIEGVPYLDRDLAESDAARLASTLARFHHSAWQDGLCLCHWDNQPRNILSSGPDFFLIDFSESRRGRPEDDVSHLLLFWAAEFPSKRMEALTEAFLAAYRKIMPLDPALWKASLAGSIERFDQRRAQFGRHPEHIDPALVEANRSLLARILDFNDFPTISYH